MDAPRGQLRTGWLFGYLDRGGGVTNSGEGRSSHKGRGVWRGGSRRGPRSLGWRLRRTVCRWRSMTAGPGLVAVHLSMAHQPFLAPSAGPVSFS